MTCSPVIMSDTQSFTEMTPLVFDSMTPSSTETIDTESLSDGPHQDFHDLIRDLEFQPTISTKNSENDINSQWVNVSEDEDEDEDTSVKYPYQRKNEYEGFTKRITERLQNGSFETPEEVDAKFKELEEAINLESEKERLEKVYRGKALYSEGSIFSCLFCSKAFKDSDQLTSHVQKFHDFSKSQFRCSKCPRSYKRRKNLEEHLRNHMKIEFSCKECILVFKTEASLLAHMGNKHGSDEMGVKQCSVCHDLIAEATFKRHEYYCRNKELISKKRAEKKSMSVPASPALSMISQTSFSSLRPFASTSASTSPQVTYVDKTCRVCNAIFASRQSMLRHVGRKHPEHKDNADVVALRYVSQGESPSHQYACVECGKRVTTKAALTLHKQRAHENRNDHACEICHKSYPIASELKKHVIAVHQKQSSMKPIIEDDSLDCF